MLKSTQKALVLVKSVDYPKNVLLRVINYDNDYNECKIDSMILFSQFTIGERFRRLATEFR